MYTPKELEQYRRDFEQWEETTLKETLAHHPERREEFITTSSAPVGRLYELSLLRTVHHISQELLQAFRP